MGRLSTPRGMLGLGYEDEVEPRRSASSKLLSEFQALLPGVSQALRPKCPPESSHRKRSNDASTKSLSVKVPE